MTKRKRNRGPVGAYEKNVGRCFFGKKQISAGASGMSESSKNEKATQ